MGRPRRVGRAAAKVQAPATRWQQVIRTTHFLRRTAAGMGALLGLILLGLSLMIVPAPSARTATQITGTVASISRPHATGGDMTILLQDGRKFYVNRANEIDHFDWERMLREVKPGDTIRLTAVQAFAWRGVEPGRGGGYTPLAGIRTESVLYLDEQIAARTWSSVETTTWMGLAALLVACICILPEALNRLRR